MEALEAAQRSIVPLLADLELLLEGEGPHPCLDFFRGIRTRIESARSDDDLADPFMALVMSAELHLRHPFSPAASFLIDRVLADAQALASRLGAQSTRH